MRVLTHSLSYRKRFRTIGEATMKEKIHNLLKNDVLQAMLFGVFSYTCFIAVILTTLEIPPEAILDSGLKEIILVFEG